MTLLPIHQMLKEINARETAHKDRMEAAKLRLGQYTAIIRQDFEEIVAGKARECSILDKIIMQISELGAEGAEAIENVINFNFSKVEKPVLVKLFKMVESSIGSTSRDDQLGELEKELNSKEARLEESLKEFRESQAVRRIFTLNLYNSEKCQRYNRFDGETSSWSFSTGKIDAIEFIATEDVFLKGYIHFGLIEFPSTPTIKLQVILYEKASGAEIMNIQREFTKD